MPQATIQINTSHYKGKNKFTYPFPTPIELLNAKVKVESISIYNSTQNIKTSYDNTTFTIKWLGTDYSITIPAGYYDLSQLNGYIRQQCLLNKLYCDTSTNKIAYFFNLSENATRYKSQLDIYTIPTAAEAATLGYTLPSGASWAFPGSATTGQIQISTGLMTLLGFDTQVLFPTTTQSTNQTFVSDRRPIVSPVFCYLFTCNLINTGFSALPDLFYQLPIKSAFGELLDSDVQNDYVDVAPRSYNEINILLFDQNQNPLEILDEEFAMTLTITM